MYFSRIQLRDDADPRKLVGLDGYREHQALWNLFDPDPEAQRDFLFRRDGQPHRPIYFLVSERKPSDRENLWEVETKPYQPQLKVGSVLAFSLRANPAISRTNSQGKSQRNDLVMDIKTQLNWKSLPNSDRPSLPQLVQQAGEQWMHKRENSIGVKLQNLQADAYRQHSSYKRGQDNPIKYSSFDLQGTLTVSDGDALLNALFRGIGPAKAFGCGLLLVRRV